MFSLAREVGTNTGPTVAKSKREVMEHVRIAAVMACGVAYADRFTPPSQAVTAFTSPKKRKSAHPDTSNTRWFAASGAESLLYGMRPGEAPQNDALSFGDMMNGV